jgi:hypothetical protein
LKHERSIDRASAGIVSSILELFAYVRSGSEAGIIASAETMRQQSDSNPKRQLNGSQFLEAAEQWAVRQS